MGANYSRSVLKRGMTSETDDMLAVKWGQTGTKIRESVVARR